MGSGVSVQKQSSTGFSDRFPTPHVLRSAQQAYIDSSPQLKYDSEGVPLPHPPRSFKSTVFQLEDYVDIDKHAIKAPAALRKGSFKELVEYLLTPCRTEMQRVRVLFRWIAAQNLGALNLRTPVKDDTPLDYLQCIGKETRSYEGLTERLMKEAGIPVHVVTGKMKASGYKIGDSSSIGSGSWNCVCIDGDWRIINTRWACVSSSGGQTDWMELENTNRTGGAAQRPAATEKRTNYGECREEYFLCDPHEVASFLRADEEEWQLLARPVSSEEFNTMAYLRKGFFENNLTLESEPYCEMQSEKGVKVIEFGCLDSENYNLYKPYYEFFVSEGSYNQAEHEGAQQTDFVRVERDPKNSRFTVRVRFPITGRFLLEFYMALVPPSRTSFTYDYCYGCVITCDATNKYKANPFPNTPGNQIGLMPEAEGIGIEQVSHIGGQADTANGELEIKFIAPPNVRLQYELLAYGRHKSELSGAVVMHRDGEHVTSNVKIPGRGEYALVFYGRGPDGTKSNICNYLIDSNNCALLSGNFPAVKDGLLGLTKTAESMGIRTTENNSFFSVSKEHELVLECDEEYVFDWELSLRSTNEPEDMKQYCFIDTEDNNNPKFLFRFPRPGTYHFKLSAKKKMEKSSKEVANYIFNVKDAQYAADPFPARGEGWRPDIILIKPRQGNLQPNTEYEVIVKAPADVNNITIQHQNEAVVMERQSENTLKGVIKTNNSGGELYIHQKDKKKRLYTFNVLKPSQVMDKSKSDKEAKKDFDKLVAQRKKEEKDWEKEKQAYYADLEKRERQKRGRDYEKVKREVELARKEREERARKKKETARKEEEERNKDRDERRKSEHRETLIRKIRSCMKRHERDELTRTLATFRKEFGSDVDDPVLKEANEYIELMDCKAALEKSKQTRNYDDLVAAVNLVRQKGFETRLQIELEECERRIKMMEPHDKKGLRKLKLDVRALQELKRLSDPPDPVHQVTRAALLLLGIPTKETKLWLECRKVISDTPLLLREMDEFNEDDVQPEIAAKAQHLLGGITEDEGAFISASIAPIVKWVRNVLDTFGNLDEVTVPTSKQEREILKRFERKV